VTYRRPALARATVDRAAEHRADDAWLADAWARAKVLRWDGEKVAVDGEGLLVTDPDDSPGERYFLGVDDDGTPWFAAVGRLPLGAFGGTLRDVGTRLNDRDAGLVVHTIGLSLWHARHPRCAVCGEPTVVALAGHIRRCPACGAEHFPRTDPAVIMLVHDGGDRCLLGRQASWPPNRYSTLAGFVEPGESLEMAVAREVHEEAGLAVLASQYVSSQPWPFPSSLMVGFIARVEYGEPRLVDGELEEARWFTREELRSGSIGLSPEVSIARTLIDGWLDATPGEDAPTVEP
jgi:NAD+ diphosphatase